MEFCTITPLKNLDLMYEKKYVMLLAHLSAESALYREYARNSHAYKIMDNSIIELGSAFSMGNLIKEAEACGADEIILPDEFDDGDATVAKAKESIAWLRDHNLLGRFKLMAVCHGKDAAELYQTFRQLDAMPEVDAIGFPKVLTTHFESRVLLAECYARMTDKAIHLLGCWSSLAELREIAANTPIRSMDTCLPALASICDMATFDDRHGATIDLSEAEVDLPRYRDIMAEVDSLPCFAATN